MKPGRRPKIQRPTGEPYRIAPPAPKWLSPRGKAKWRAIAPGMVKEGRLTPDVVDLVAHYVAELAIAEECAEIISREGPIITARNGSPARHPALIVRDRAIASAGRLAAELGFTRSTSGAASSPSPGVSIPGLDC